MIFSIGLDLAIFQEIAHQHEATLTVEDKTQEQGTRVRVSFQT